MGDERHTPERLPQRGATPSVMDEERHTPERIPSRGATPSTPGDDQRTPQRTPQRAHSRAAGPPSVITEEDFEQPPGHMIHRVPEPAPPHPSPPPPDPDVEDALRRLDDAERELGQFVHDAQDAEGRRERDFRDNEDARERIFLDNEERRDAETRQRGDTLFNELEDRIAGIPPVPPVPVPPPQEPRDDDDQRSFIDSIHASLQESATRHSHDIMETVRMEREEAARERESLAAERERERARLDEERHLLEEERLVKITALEDELARTRAELDNERQMRMNEQNEARMAAAERDEALRNQLVDLTNMVQQNQALCEEKRALMDEHWEEKRRWKEERDGQMQELMGMVARLADEQAGARQREEEQRLANEGKPGELNNYLRLLLGSSWRIQESSRSWKNFSDRMLSKENFSMLCQTVSGSGFP